MLFSSRIGTQLLATTNRTGYSRPLLWDVRTNDRIDLALGEFEGDVVPVDWSSDGNAVLLCEFAQGVQQLRVYDLGSGMLRRLAHPSGTFGYAVSFFSDPGAYFAPTGEIFALWNDAANPPRLIALDAQTGAQTRTVLAAGEVPPGHAWRSVRFSSSDGALIHGWLGVPRGTGEFPAIVHAHGGPNVVMTNTFSAPAQAWLDHGFAYLTVNYRGSTTFGRAFQEGVVGRPGYWEVEDLVAARAWLVAQGIARPEHVFLQGWSYGGLLVLLALGKYPQLWAGGLAGVAIGDCVAAYQELPERLKAVVVRRYGGTPDEQPERWKEGSPITYAEQISAPILIIQGRLDARCPARQLEQYEARLRALGKAIEVHWLETGHVGPRAEGGQGIAYQELMLRFANRVIQQARVG